MNKPRIAASVLSAAIGIALAAPAALAQGMPDPPPIVKENMQRMAQQHLEKCYGVNAVAKNDCAQGAHSCAGQATIARDPKSFVLLPAGDCAKIAGGRLTATDRQRTMLSLRTAASVESVRSGACRDRLRFRHHEAVFDGHPQVAGSRSIRRTISAAAFRCVISKRSGAILAVVPRRRAVAGQRRRTTPAISIASGNWLPAFSPNSFPSTFHGASLTGAILRTCCRCR